jgi:hypothetical protein
MATDLRGVTTTTTIGIARNTPTAILTTSTHHDETTRNVTTTVSVIVKNIRDIKTNVRLRIVT